MKKIVLSFMVLAALLVMACTPTVDPAVPSISNSEVAAVMSEAGQAVYTQGLSSGKAVSTTNINTTITSAYGGSATLVMVYDMAAGSMSGTVSYSKFSVASSQGATYVIDGTENLSMTMTSVTVSNITKLTMDQTISGDLVITKGSAKRDFNINLVSKMETTMDMNTSPATSTGSMTITGTIGGETVNQTLTF